MKVFLIVLSTIVLAACGAKKSQDSNQASGVSIIGGKKVQAGEALAASVVAVWNQNNEFLCTGTLIAEDIVMTAAHCVVGSPAQTKIIFGTDAFLTLNAREVDVQTEMVRRAIKTKVHEGYETDPEKESEIDQNDIALIKFVGPLPEGFKPVARVQDAKDLALGVEATVAGYGVRHVDVKEVDPKKYNPKKLSEALEMGSVICDENGTVCLEIEMSGDGDLYSAVAPMKAFTESEVRLDESKGQGTCSGDSGGPAFIFKDGAYQIFGVTSRGNMLCDEEGVYTNVVAHSSWLEKNLQDLK